VADSKLSESVEAHKAALAGLRMREQESHTKRTLLPKDLKRAKSIAERTRREMLKANEAAAERFKRNHSEGF
jgi:hypothetical protein